MLPENNGDNNAGNNDAGNNNNNTGDNIQVSKAEFESIKANLEKSLKENEDLRSVVLTEEYTQFLDSLEKGKSADTKQNQDKTSDLKDLDKLSKEDILRLAKEQAKAELKTELDAINEKVSTVSSEAVQREIATFAASHPDFEKLRPTMHGLSVDPKHSSKSLQELYDTAKNMFKENVDSLVQEELKRHRGLGGERPGGNNEAYETLRKMSPADATNKAMAEVEAKLGLFPIE